jgi:hypothetical protein
VVVKPINRQQPRTPAPGPNAGDCAAPAFTKEPPINPSPVIATKALNQAAKRNIDRFPGDSMFQLSRSEKDEAVTTCDHLANLINKNPAHSAL